MGYREYACSAFMLPATLENARKLGISQKEIDDIIQMTDDTTIEANWKEGILQAGYDNVELVGRTEDGESFTIFVIHVGEVVDCDDDMDMNENTFFSFDFNELYMPMPLFFKLKHIGMAEHSWIEGG
jgi:hypothetical protein